MMTIWDLLKMEDADIDTYDTVFDICVTVDDITDMELKDFYYKFSAFIYHSVEVERIVRGGDAVCKWYDFIERNLEIFKAAAEELWENTYDDDKEELIYQWIKEIGLWLAGYVSEGIYKLFMEKYAVRIGGKS